MIHQVIQIYHSTLELFFFLSCFFSLLFKFTLSARLSTNLFLSEVLLFPKFLSIVFTLYYIYIELIILLYTLLMIDLLLNTKNI